MHPAVTLSMIILSLMELGFARNSTFGCIERERNALLRFRASLEDPSSRFSSWNHKNQDCCSWQGVGCNKITRHVISLDLSTKIDADASYGDMLQGTTLDSSLLELKYLSYLDLSWNYFQSSKIPPFLGSMEQLQHLNLSNCFFHGLVPHHLGNLSSLRVLDLNYNDLVVDDLRWATNLSSLEYLDMSCVNLSSIKDAFEVLNMLPSLRILHLKNSQLSNTHLPHASVNSTLLVNLLHLDLARNKFYGEFPSFIQNMTTLSFLDLSINLFNFSRTSHILGLKNLAHLNLFFNSLALEVEWISDFMWDKCHLKSLDLSGNYLDGDISGLNRNLSGCWSRSLESLSLGYNKLNGHIPTSIGKLSSLAELDLSNNNLSGPIPSSLGNLRSLRVLNLQTNQLSGRVPVSLGQLSNLESIDISNNSFDGALTETHFAKLSKLEYLRAEYTMLGFRVGHGWVPPFQLKELTMGSSKFGGQFPKWLQTQTRLISLDLSNCSIIGTLPRRLDSENLTHVDLSHNNVTGPIPKLASTMKILDLSNNMITHDLPNNIGHVMPLLVNLLLTQNSINGTIPDSLCELRLLETLDLSKNRLSGNLPDCWPNFQYLYVARLSFNELSGVIPNSIGGANVLGWLHLNNNKFTGKLPSTLKNCTSLIVLDVGGNSLSGKLPEWIGKGLPALMVLILRNNEFNGIIPSAFCQLSQLQVMNLANNKLTGTIPHCFGNLTGMTKIVWNQYYLQWDKESLSQVIKGVELEYTRNSRVLVNLDLSRNHLVGEIPSALTSLYGLVGLNLSHNQLRGEIPAKIGDLKYLLSLDLSSNGLSGKIPESLSDLSFLSYLNFSNNNLSGQIPTGNQLQTLTDPSIYGGNPQLCGAPLPKKCSIDGAAKAPENQGAGDEDRDDKVGFYAFVGAGFATGVLGLIGVLVGKVKWRRLISGLLKLWLIRYWDIKLAKKIGSLTIPLLQCIIAQLCILLRFVLFCF